MSHSSTAGRSGDAWSRGGWLAGGSGGWGWGWEGGGGGAGREVHLQGDSWFGFIPLQCFLLFSLLFQILLPSPAIHGLSRAAYPCKHAFPHVSPGNPIASFGDYRCLVDKMDSRLDPTFFKVVTPCLGEKSS